MIFGQRRQNTSHAWTDNNGLHEGAYGASRLLWWEPQCGGVVLISYLKLPSSLVTPARTHTDTHAHTCRKGSITRALKSQCPTSSSSWGSVMKAMTIWPTWAYCQKSCSTLLTTRALRWRCKTCGCPPWVITYELRICDKCDWHVIQCIMLLFSSALGAAPELELPRAHSNSKAWALVKNLEISLFYFCKLPLYRQIQLCNLNLILTLV